MKRAMCANDRYGVDTRRTDVPTTKYIWGMAVFANTATAPLHPCVLSQPLSSTGPLTMILWWRMLHVQIYIHILGSRDHSPTQSHTVLPFLNTHTHKHCQLYLLICFDYISNIVMNYDTYGTKCKLNDSICFCGMVKN